LPGRCFDPSAAGSFSFGGVMLDGPMLRTHGARMETLMLHFHRLQVPIAVCASPGYLARKPKTLKAYARRLGLAFPDYTPRPKKKKRRAKKKRARH
jgi:hypothetical protein